MTGPRDPASQRALNTSLLDAIEADDYDATFTAILSGADARQDNDAPIGLAASRGHAAIVGLLLEAGADYSVHDHKPLRDAEMSGHQEAARVLRRAGSYNPSVAGDFERAVAERTAREHCAENGDASFEEVRDDVLRMLEDRRRLAAPPKP